MERWCPKCGGKVDYKYIKKVDTYDSKVVIQHYRGFCSTCHNNYRWQVIATELEEDN